MGDDNPYMAAAEKLALLRDSGLIPQNEADGRAARLDKLLGAAEHMNYACQTDEAVRTLADRVLTRAMEIVTGERSEEWGDLIGLSSVTQIYRHCQNGLVPDGPICPSCGGLRVPSAPESGWVHCDDSPRTRGPDHVA